MVDLYWDTMLTLVSYKSSILQMQLSQGLLIMF